MMLVSVFEIREIIAILENDSAVRSDKVIRAVSLFFEEA